jgi:hypothetical protein
VDKKSTCVWLEECSQELVSATAFLRVPALRYLEEKVHLKAMTNPENVDDSISSHSLMKYAR